MAGPAPPRALTLTLSRPAGEGILVADEVFSFWLPRPLGPFPLTLALSHGGERGYWWWTSVLRWWWFGW